MDGVAAAKLESDAAKAEADHSPASQRRMIEAGRLVQDGADKPFLSACFADNKNGLIAGAYGLIFATDDGGKTWRSIIGKTQNPNGHHLYAIRSGGGADLYIVGEQGTLLASNDAGKSFNALPTLGKGTLFGLIDGGNGQALIAYGLKGNVYRSADRGKHWDRVDMPPVSLTAGLRLSNGDMVLADEAGQLYRSKDDGKRFNPLPVNNPIPITSLVEAGDGTLIQSGIRGVGRVELNNKGEKL